MKNFTNSQYLDFFKKELGKIKIPTHEQYETMLHYKGFKEQDAYYTPDNIVGFCEEYIQNHKEIPHKFVFEPSCGIGNFIDIAPFDDKNCTVYATEIDPIARKITELREIYNNKKLKTPQKKCFKVFDFYLEQFFLKEKSKDKFNKDIFHFFNEDIKRNGGFDLVIGNPPYGQMLKKNIIYQSHPKHHLCQQYEAYFLLQCFELLKVGGFLMFILPYNFMCNYHSYNKVKKTMLLNGDFIDAYRFANKFNDTSVITDLLIFKRTSKNWEVAK